MYSLGKELKEFFKSKDEFSDEEWKSKVEDIFSSELAPNEIDFMWKILTGADYGKIETSKELLILLEYTSKFHKERIRNLMKDISNDVLNNFLLNALMMSSQELLSNIEELFGNTDPQVILSDLNL